MERPKVALATRSTPEEFYQHSRAINRLSDTEYEQAVLKENLDSEDNDLSAIILKSPNGTLYRVTVSNAGVLVVTAV